MGHTEERDSKHGTGGWVWSIMDSISTDETDRSRRGLLQPTGKHKDRQMALQQEKQRDMRLWNKARKQYSMRILIPSAARRALGLSGRGRRQIQRRELRHFVGTM